MSYDLVLADPPWRYSFSRSKSRRVENHYGTMTLADICALPVAGVCADDSVLFLWATAPKLPEAMAVMAARGFTYVTNAVWDKRRIGMGYYFRGRHELILVGKRGRPAVPIPAARAPSVIEASRSAHSAKPAVVYEILERAYPQARKLEMFARASRPGWHAWGDAVDSDIEFEGVA